MSFRKSNLVFALLIGITLSTNIVEGQDGNRSVARIVYLQEETTIGGGLTESLESLKLETKALSNQLSNPRSLPQKALVTPAKRLPPPEVDMPEPEQKIGQGSLNGTNSTNDIYQRIELLNQIYDERKAELARKKAKEENAQQETKPVDPESMGGTVENQVTPEATDSPETQDWTQGVGIQATPSDSNPVDVFELGNSLYQTGRIETALRAYQQVDRSTLTATEGVWLDFQLANSYRRLGEVEKAKTLYRAIANQSDAANLVKPAQMWLKQLAVTAKFESTMKLIESELTSQQERAIQHVSK